MVVILTDISSFQSDKLMYVALSRARSGLYILMSESAQNEYLELKRRRLMFNGRQSEGTIVSNNQA